MMAELAVARGKHFQAFPEYGPERSGAPIVAFTRISDEPIQTYAPIQHPGVILVLDETLISTVDVMDGSAKDAIVIVNTERSPEQIKARGGLEGARVMTIAATRISNDNLGRNLPNTPMVGAAAKATGLFTLDEETCTQCLFCYFFCPDASVVVEDQKVVAFDYDHCKGCGICMVECPPDAISMHPESEFTEEGS